jgi:hypothetical protein
MAERRFRQLSIGLRRGATTTRPKPSVLEAGSLVPSNDQAVTVEVWIACSVLNGMTLMGKPISQRV